MSVIHTIKIVTFIVPFLGNSVLFLLDKVGILALLSLLGLPVIMTVTLVVADLF